MGERRGNTLDMGWKVKQKLSNNNINMKPELSIVYQHGY